MGPGEPEALARLRPWLRPGLALVALLGAGGFLLASRTVAPVPRWIATAVVLLALGGLWPHLRAGLALAGRPVAARPRIATALPLVLVAAGVVAALWPLSSGVMPIGQDHPYHYLSTHVMAKDMLAHGRLFGWTDRVSTGLPFGDAYGHGVYLWTSLLHVASFGAIPVRASYGFGVFGAWLVGALAVAAWSRRLTDVRLPGVRRTTEQGKAGARPSTWWIAPLFAGVLYALDPGGERQGGWIYSMFHGVWPQFLASGLWLLSLLAMVRLAERQTASRLGVAVLVTLAAMWAHPMNLINNLITAPIVFAAVVFARPSEPDTEDASDPRRGALWITVAYASAGLGALGWAQRMRAAAEEGLVYEHVSFWGPLEDLALGVLKGELMDHQLPWIMVGGVIGAAIAVRRLRTVDVLSVVLIAAFLVVGSMDPLVSFDLGLHEDHKSLMYNRFTMSVKPLWYALAGAAAAAVVDRVRATSAVAGARARPWLQGLLLVALAPLLWAGWHALPSVPETPALRPLTAKTAELEGELRELRRLLEEEAKRLGDRPKRVVFWKSPTDRGAYELIAVADSGFGYLASRRSPAEVYRWFNPSRNVGAMRWLGASFLLSRHDKKIEDASLVTRIGRHRVYRLEREPSWPVRVEGPGRVDVLSWEPMQRRLRLEGVAPDSTLVLGVPPFPKWHARLEGEPVEIEPHRGVSGYRLTQVSELQDGELVLRYRDPPAQRWLLVLAGVVLAAALGLLPFVRRELPRWPRGRPLQAGGAVALGALGLVALVGISTLFDLREEARAAEWLGEAPGQRRIVSVLHHRQPDRLTRGPAYRCVRPYTRHYSVDCDERDLEPRLAPAPMDRREEPEWGTRIPSCLLFGVGDRGETRLRYDLPEGIDTLEGRLHTRNHKHARGTLRVGKAKEPLRTSGRRFSVDVPKGAGPAVVTLKPRGGATSMACLELVAVGRE